MFRSLALNISSPKPGVGLRQLKLPFCRGISSLNDCRGTLIKLPAQLRSEGCNKLNVTCLGHQIPFQKIPQGSMFSFNRNIHNSVVLMSPEAGRNQDSEKRKNIIFLAAIALSVLFTVIVSVTAETHQDYVIVDNRKK